MYSMKDNKKILFIHPDLGIGGAERLVVDAALALKQKGFDVEFLTSHHDLGHCFKETKDGTLPVKVIGDFLPRNLFGYMYALCMYLRMVFIALYVVLFCEKPNLVICDLVSVSIPILHLRNIKVLFYCHYPDQLLSKKGPVLKSIYRKPLDKLEEFTICQSDKILVNSEFTKGVVKKTFPSLSADPQILYPSVNTIFFETAKPESLEKILNPKPNKEDILFLSINRFERKKNLELAIHSLLVLFNKISSENKSKVKLIIAGGYDPLNKENVEYFDELVDLSKKLDLGNSIYFLKSPSDEAKLSLLKRSHCVVYTPSNEHFGIVPIEAMACSKVVIGVNSGGPKETIVNNKTGFLCRPDDEAFADAMKAVVENKNDIRTQMSENGFARFRENFSFAAFSNQLENIVNEIIL